MKLFRATKRNGFFPLILSAGLVLLLPATSSGDGTGPVAPALLPEGEAAGVVVEHRTEEQATIYSISSGDCKIEWIARRSEIGVVKHRSLCAAPLAVQLPLLAQVCTEFFQRDEHAQAFRTLFWGRLEPEVRNGSREMSLRLALAAHKSPGWDAKRGKPRSGDVNGFVKDLANRDLIYSELKTLFEPFHRTIAFSCAEKVLVQKAEELPFFDLLKQEGVKASDRLPFDCMTWFSISGP